MKMTNKRLQQIVNDKLEGNILPERRLLELEDMLMESEEARLYLHQMESIHHSLQEAGEEKLEVDVTEQVMNRVRQLHEQKVPSLAFRPVYYLSAYNKQLMRYAALLVFGLIMGSAFTYMVFHWSGGLERDNISATITTRSDQAVDSGGTSWQLFTQPVVTSNVSMLVVSLKTNELSSVNITYDQQAFRLESTRFLNYAMRPQAITQPGNLVVESSSDMVFQVVFNRNPGVKSALLLELFQDGQPVHQREIVFE